MFTIGLAAVLAAHAAPPVEDSLVVALRKLGEQGRREWGKQKDPLGPARKEVRAEILLANRRESKLWRELKGKAQWEKYRDSRIEALKSSLGMFPEPPGDLKVRVRRTLRGDGFRIDNLTFESRPGLLVTANLYRPEKPGKAMPGIAIIHSHHAPKAQGELQDMGALWAKAGCLVLVMDQLGHGERRQHPFGAREDFPKPYRTTRQDYFFRYNLAVQLQTLGDSLMGWMAWDVRRGVDLLLSRPGIDAKKIVLLGAVAGGGDPAAVVGALEGRVAAVVPFNFGGAQPETRYPLPADAEASFNYAGSGSWESTRNLAFSARDGFLPWVIVGAVAPRRLLYGHEFAWDQERDPVWKRLRKIYSWYDHPGRLTSAHGSGSVSGQPPASTHCTNIGRVHRKGIHEALKAWFGLPPAGERQERRPAQELLCLQQGERIGPVHLLASRIARDRMQAARKRRAGLEPAEARRKLREEWGRLLGDVAPAAVGRVQGGLPVPIHPGVAALGERIDSPAGQMRLVSLLGKRRKGERLPVVVAFGQGGWPDGFLGRRAGEVADLLRSGSVVVVASLGETSNVEPGASRGRVGSATSLASTRLMLGKVTLGVQLRRLRTVLAHLRKQEFIEPRRISLWGDSFAPVNPPGTRVGVPLDLPQPAQAEPMGGVLALLGALFEEGIASVRARGGLVGYTSLLESPFCHVPYDVVVPGVLTTGDLADVAASLAPTPVRLEAMVTGRNLLAPANGAERAYEIARRAYRKAKAEEKLRIEQ
jgi:dienelactone hydrolase